MENGNFVLTVTRVTPEADIIKPPAKRVSIKPKSIIPNKLLSIYAFESFEEFCELCTYITSTRLGSKLSKSSLYNLGNKYYLIVKSNNISLKDFKHLHGAITEFSTYILNADIFERKLTEYGKIIIEKNAVKTCTKYFA